jgi:CHASE2 domain-containing sensor protein
MPRPTMRSMGDPHTPPDAGRWILWIMAAIVLWGLFHATGAWRLNHDPRRALVVIVCVAAFLGFWGGLLALRQRRLRR